MSKPTPNPKIERLHKLLDQYEEIRPLGGNEVARQAAYIALFMEYGLKDTLICRNGVRYRVEAGELVRDGNYRRPKSLRKAG